MANLDVAEDPVCGKIVGLDSIHRVEYYGKLLYFCSDACADRFIADPSAFESEGTVFMPGNLGLSANPVRKLPLPAAAIAAGQGTREPDTPPGGSASARAAVVVEHQAPADPSELTIARLPTLKKGSSSAPAGNAAPIAALASTVRIREKAKARSGALGWLLDALVRVRERRHLKAAGQEILAIFRSVEKRRDASSRRDIYRAVVMQRLGNDPEGAERLLNQAAASFASWPAQRPLTLRDVVHFVAVLEYLVAYPQARGFLVDAGRIIEGIVAPEL